MVFGGMALLSYSIAFCQILMNILCLNSGRISHVVKQAIVILQSEQYRSDDLSTTLKVLSVPKAANHTISAPIALYFLDTVAIAALVWNIQPFRDDVVASDASQRSASFSFRLAGERRKRFSLKK